MGAFDPPPLTPSQNITVMEMRQVGWEVMQRYSDGVINMGKDYEGQTAMVFMNTNGKVQPARTAGTMHANVELIGLGLLNRKRINCMHEE